MHSVSGLFLLFNAHPKVVTEDGPDLAVDLHVHLLVQLLREFKYDLIEVLLFKNVLMELFNVLLKPLNFGIVFELKDPLLEVFYSEAFLVSVTVRFYSLDDFSFYSFNIFFEILLSLSLELTKTS
jgi:hypothetical protein